MAAPVRPASASPAAASLDVFVGYADNLRANPAPRASYSPVAM